MKMLGKLRLAGGDGNIKKMMQYSKSFTSIYKNEGLSSVMTNFLDICFDERTTLDILKQTLLLKNTSNTSLNKGH